MASLNVLITAASRRVPLVQGFKQAVRALRHGGTVSVTDVNPLSPAVHVADQAWEVPLSTDPTYVDTLLAICEADEVGLLVPTIDDELSVIAAAVPRFEAMGTRVAVSPVETTDICNDKYLTARRLQAHGVFAAPTWLPSERAALPAPPVFVKPRTGRGSIGAFAARTARELDFFLEYVADPVVQEYLEGPEFTIDLFCDFLGRPIAAVPRERVVIRAGVIDRGRTVWDRALIDLAVDCAAALTFRGAVNIQCRRVDGRPVVFEINPRFSGGIPLTIAAGADFPRMLVDLVLGRPVSPQLGRFEHGLWMTSHESSIFLSRDSLDRLKPPPTLDELDRLRPAPAFGRTAIPADRREVA